MELDRRAALIAAARSIGLQPPQAEAIAALETEIDAIEPADPDLSAARRRAAEAADSVEALRERVARLSGRLAEAREAGRDTESLEDSLDEATRQLTEAETAAAAARQALETAAERAAREKRAERLSLVDRRENRRREARDWLACEARERLGKALAGLPVAAGAPQVGPEAGIPAHVVALGVVRLARVQAPVIVRDSPFEEPLRARAALSAPVILM
jgi:ABC-type transporter Mla subunit MlaD